MTFKDNVRRLLVRLVSPAWVSLIVSTFVPRVDDDAVSDSEGAGAVGS